MNTQVTTRAVERRQVKIGLAHIGALKVLEREAQRVASLHQCYWRSTGSCLVPSAMLSAALRLMLGLCLHSPSVPSRDSWARDGSLGEKAAEARHSLSSAASTLQGKYALNLLWGLFGLSRCWCEYVGY